MFTSYCRTILTTSVSDLHRIAQVGAISHIKWTVKEVFLCQVPIGEATYGRRDSRLVQQSQRWLGNQSRWCKRDADGNAEVIKCHWQVSGSGIFEGLFSAWVTDGRLTLLSGPMLGHGVFKHLFKWLLAKWYSSVIPFFCEPLPWCFTVSRGSRSPSWTVARHTCSCRWVSSEGELLQRREIYRSRQYFCEGVKTATRISEASQYCWGSVWKPSYCVWSPASDCGSERLGCLQFLSGCWRLSETLCEADFHEMVEKMFWQQCFNLYNICGVSKDLFIWVKGRVCLCSSTTVMFHAIATLLYLL